jgi:hypothetical protein
VTCLACTLLQSVTVTCGVHACTRLLAVPPVDDDGAKSRQDLVRDAAEKQFNKGTQIVEQAAGDVVDDVRQEYHRHKKDVKKLISLV